MKRLVLFLAIGILVGIGGTVAYLRVAAPAGGAGAPSAAATQASGRLSPAGASPGGAPGPAGSASPAAGESAVPLASFAEAELRPARTADLAFQVPGVVAERLVQVGDSVDAGAPLLRLDSAEQRAQLKQAEAALEAAAAQVTVAQAAEEAARQQVVAASAGVDVAKAKLQDAETAVRQTLQEAQATIARAEAQRAAAAAGVTQAEATAQQAQAALQQATAAVSVAMAQRDEAAAARDQAALAVDRRELRAPFGGRVMAVNAEVGEAVGAGGSAAGASAPAAVITLADTSAWLADTTNLTERQVVGVRVGSRVEVAVDALPGRAFRGEVERLGGVPEIVRGDVTYVATVRILPDPASAQDLALLRPGMSAVVRQLVR